MRLFIAINFNKDTMSKLFDICEWLKAGSEQGRFSDPENLHLTLAFLGECRMAQALSAKSAMDASRFSPFAVSIDRVGRFRRDGGDIWWAGVRESKPLTDLQRRLSDHLTAKGFTLDTRKFSPHITLGREVVTQLQPKTLEPFGETVSAVELMKSERIQGKLVYSQLRL